MYAKITLSINFRNSDLYFSNVIFQTWLVFIQNGDSEMTGKAPGLKKQGEQVATNAKNS